MRDDNRNLARQLFALATERLEAAHEIAMEGQRAGLAAQAYSDMARRLEATVHDVATLAAAIATVVKSAQDRNTN